MPFRNILLIQLRYYSWTKALNLVFSKNKWNFSSSYGSLHDSLGLQLVVRCVLELDLTPFRIYPTSPYNEPILLMSRVLWFLDWLILVWLISLLLNFSQWIKVQLILYIHVARWVMVSTLNLHILWSLVWEYV